MKYSGIGGIEITKEQYEACLLCVKESGMCHVPYTGGCENLAPKEPNGQ